VDGHRVECGREGLAGLSTGASSAVAAGT
jgi:hypothetical protein